MLNSGIGRAMNVNAFSGLGPRSTLFARFLALVFICSSYLALGPLFALFRPHDADNIRFS
jgi:hypothetical protein